MRRPKLLLVAVALAACGLAAPSSPAPAKAPKPKKLRVTVLDTLSHAPLYIAEEEGFFADEGLAIDGLTFRDTAAALPGLAAGDIDVYLGTIGPNVLNLIARAGNVKLVVARSGQRPEGCAAYAIVAKRELVESGRLKRPADLRGLRIGTERTSANFYVISALLEAGGLTLDDVEASNVPPRLKPEAFERDLLDVSTSSEPWMTRMVESGSAAVWLPTRDIVPGFQYGVMLFGPRLLEDDRESGRRFVTAYLRGVRQYARDGKTDRHVAIVAQRLRLDADFVRRTCWPYHPPDGHVDRDSLDRYQTWAVKAGFLDRKLAADEVWDRSFVDHANAVLDRRE